MKRVVTVPPAARAAFALALKPLSAHAAALPDPLPMGRVLCIVDNAVDTAGELRVFAGKSERGYFLDHIAKGRDGFRHGRVYDNGTIDCAQLLAPEILAPVVP